MTSDNRPISFSTLFSLGLHGLLAVAVIQPQQIMLATGSGLEIELVSSTYISDQTETEQAASRAEASAQKQRQADNPVDSGIPTPPDQPGRAVVAEKNKPSAEVITAAETVAEDDGTGEQVSTRSTNAAAHKRSIIELLHTEISAHKQYPYLARRQRREGVATVEFVLRPDGSILNPRLVHSSRTRSLDKAALDAVRGIEPFGLARDYIDQPEAYRVDVVFNVL
ncbi:MAG: energy transducer TonB [Thiotrichales bacterium]|nr:MAG: energy transducer TonB [Thiotrichales bacterium]